MPFLLVGFSLKRHDTEKCNTLEEIIAFITTNKILQLESRQTQHYLGSCNTVNLACFYFLVWN